MKKTKKIRLRVSQADSPRRIKTEKVRKDTPESEQAHSLRRIKSEKVGKDTPVSEAASFPQEYEMQKVVSEKSKRTVPFDSRLRASQAQSHLNQSEDVGQ